MEKFKEICQSIKFLAGLRDEEYEFLEPLFVEKKYQADELIFHGGDLDLCLYIILKGRIKIFKELPRENATVDIAGIGSGECFGEMAFVDNMPRSASAMTLTKSTIYILSQENFRSFREKFPIAGHKIESGMLRMTIQRLRKTSERFSYISVFGNFMKDALEKKRKDLKLAHAAAIAANSFLTSIMNTSPDIIIFIDVDNKITLFNRGAETITGYEAETVRGRLIDIIFPSNLIEIIRRRLKENNKIINHEIAIRKKDGTYIPVMISAAVMMENGIELGSVITGQDITIKKELEEKIMENEKLSLLGQLAGEIVHEIKNPVHNIMLATSYMRGTLLGTLGDNVDKSIKSIDIQLDRINQIIKNILLFMTPSDEEKEELSINEIIQTSINFVEPTISRKINISYESIGSEPFIFGNKHQLIQLFINLLNNSASFLNEGGDILVVSEPADKDILIKLKDSGPGFSEDILPHIFKPFYTTRKNKGGSGLGLTICKKIVESHSGFISGENWENGALINLSFPKWFKGENK